MSASHPKADRLDRPRRSAASTGQRKQDGFQCPTTAPTISMQPATPQKAATAPQRSEDSQHYKSPTTPMRDEWSATESMGNKLPLTGVISSPLKALAIGPNTCPDRHGRSRCEQFPVEAVLARLERR
jgi:hypothetical protein